MGKGWDIAKFATTKEKENIIIGELEGGRLLQKGDIPKESINFLRENQNQFVQDVN